MAPRPGPRDPVAGGILYRCEVHAPSLGGCLPQHQCCARRRVNLVVVMGLDHFDVEILVQRGGDLFGQLNQQVDAKAHVAGAHDGAMAAGRFQLRDLRLCHAGGPDDVGRAGLGRDLAQRKGRLRGGKIDDGLRLGHSLKHIIADQHAQGRAAHGHAYILTDPIVPGPLQRARKPHRVAGHHGLDQHLAHAARCPCNHNTRQF
mmetsp:Transcript_28897/g.55104  ORF Transcript_28897/g.55104 Transcript_28897/m.55104 type:complete len:203 (-) Transcript_28897:18-626(-)